MAASTAVNHNGQLVKLRKEEKASNYINEFRSLQPQRLSKAMRIGEVIEKARSSSWRANKEFSSKKQSGLVQGWAAIVMGILSGSIPWFTMMVVHKRSPILQKVDDTLGVFHTHAVAGLIGLSTASSPADPLLPLPPSLTNFRGGLLRPQRWRLPFVKQIIGALFIIGWNVVVTTIICLVIRTVVPLRMPEEELTIGDDAVHGEEAYALWGDGEKFDITRHGWASGEDGTQHDKVPSGVTQNV
ncbi:uncharacterized protein A4U43_C08F18700 [Asparagus officinalis]|nr:uncharacterized protein A4U43_C08F18700 [Asparagus officinalis]